MSTGAGSNEERVKAEWTDEATAQAWRRWHDKSERFWSELTDAMLEIALLGPGHRVLDLASGTGDPALTFAPLIEPGRIVLTDLSPQMVKIARENADRSGVRNASFEVADAHALHFPDSSFDRVTCRLGVMYFWDCGRALREVRRVLKPGGIAAFAAWGAPEKNEYIHAALGPFKARRPMPESGPDTPQPYRFCKPGSLGAELTAAGFSGVEEETRTARLAWPGPPEELWRRLYEVSAPFRPYFDSFPEDEKQAATREAVANLAKLSKGGEVVTRAEVVLASATK